MDLNSVGVEGGQVWVEGGKAGVGGGRAARGWGEGGRGEGGGEVRVGGGGGRAGGNGGRALWCSSSRCDRLQGGVEWRLRILGVHIIMKAEPASDNKW